MSNIIWGIDVSSWQSYGDTVPDGWYKSELDQFPLDRMYDNGCRFGIVKSSMQLGEDKTVNDHVRILRNAGMDIGLYHWCDPIGNYQLQVDTFSGVIKRLNPIIVSYDIEQYWSDWGDKSNPDKILSEQTIINNYTYLFNKINNLGMHSMRRTLEYTARWFQDSFIPTLYHKLGLTDLWHAQYSMAREYIYNNFPVGAWDASMWKLTSWDQVHQTLEYLHDNWQTWHDNSVFKKCFLPRGYTESKVWQIESKTALPGAPYNIDLNIWMGTQEEYETWMYRSEEPLEPDYDILERLKRLEEQYGVTLEKLEQIKSLL